MVISNEMYETSFRRFYNFKWLLSIVECDIETTQNLYFKTIGTLKIITDITVITIILLQMEMLYFLM